MHSRCQKVQNYVCFSSVWCCVIFLKSMNMHDEKTKCECLLMSIFSDSTGKSKEWLDKPRPSYAVSNRAY